MNQSLGPVICLRPFYALLLSIRGDVSVCCAAWSKRPIGNTKRKSLIEIWNDAPIRDMRQMMLEGKWEKICRPSCPYIMKYRLSGEATPIAEADPFAITEDILAAVRSGSTTVPYGPTWMSLANSTVCNIDCIMCGSKHHKDDTELIKRVSGEVKELLPGMRELFMTGNGDAFARPDTRELLFNIDSARYPDLKINLLTNGLLLPKYWDRIKNLNFGYLDMSVDAATPETYERIRRGGKWQDLMRTFETVSADRDRFSWITINMTVMRENYREIPLFVELASRYGFGVGINRIRGRWGDQNFFTSQESDVLDELRGLILDAQSRAQALNVPLNASTFNDIIAGEPLPRGERYRQLTVDFLRSVYYKLLSSRPA